MLVLNSPHNPTGKVFTLAEMEAIAEIVRAHPNLIVISDEVYKFSVYNPLELGDSTSTGHYHFARLPGKLFALLTLETRAMQCQNITIQSMPEIIRKQVDKETPILICQYYTVLYKPFFCFFGSRSQVCSIGRLLSRVAEKLSL
jgi:bifunctional pyridoxal-dependent enzyme with beta-cystathionase and maltose regulon repressor activities